MPVNCSTDIATGENLWVCQAYFSKGWLWWCSQALKPHSWKVEAVRWLHIWHQPVLYIMSQANQGFMVRSYLTHTNEDYFSKISPKSQPLRTWKRNKTTQSTCLTLSELFCDLIQLPKQWWQIRKTIFLDPTRLSEAPKIKETEPSLQTTPGHTLSSSAMLTFSVQFSCWVGMLLSA